MSQHVSIAHAAHAGAQRVATDPASKSLFGDGSRRLFKGEREESPIGADSGFEDGERADLPERRIWGGAKNIYLGVLSPLRQQGQGRAGQAGRRTHSQCTL